MGCDQVPSSALISEGWVLVTISESNAYCIGLTIINFQKRYATTESTLSSHGENFFTALLAGRMDTVKDEEGAIFIDSEQINNNYIVK